MNTIIDEVEELIPEDPFKFVTASGVVLKLKKVSRLLVADASKKIKMPKVPTWINEEKGREEENPNDPDYLQAVQDAKYQQAMLVYTVYLAFGTEVESQPITMSQYFETDWADEIKETLDIDIPDKPKSRYVTWLKYVALDDEEVNVIMTRIMRLSGTLKEEDVQEVMDSFRSNKERNPSEEVPSS